MDRLRGHESDGFAFWCLQSEGEVSGGNKSNRSNGPEEKSVYPENKIMSGNDICTEK